MLLPPKMDHNDFDFCEDLITPFFHFMKQCGIESKGDNIIAIPNDYLIIPKAYQQQVVQATWSCYCNQYHNSVIDRETNPFPGFSEHESSRPSMPGGSVVSICRDSYISQVVKNSATLQFKDLMQPRNSAEATFRKGILERKNRINKTWMVGSWNF